MTWEKFCSIQGTPLFNLPRWRSSIISLKEDDDLFALSGAQPNSPTSLLFAPRFKWGDFETLSYVWGPKNSDGCISINGTLVAVQRNVELALRRLRELPETRCGMKYWIDAICINQNDVDERSTQVKRMHEIYGRAWSVVIWLGEETHSSDTAVDLIAKVAKDKEEYEYEYRRDGSTMESKFGAADWVSLLSLFDWPYWRRVWVVQELALNHNLTTFICGQRIFFRDELERTLQFCFATIASIRIALSQSTEEVFPSRFDPWPVFTHRHNLITNRTATADDVDTNFDALNLSQQGEAMDDRDKIYGIHRLLDQELRTSIVPDYHLSAETIYIDFANAYLRSKGLGSLLIWGGNCGQRQLPSWVPDWTVPAIRNHVRMLEQRQASASVALRHSVTNNGKVLFCEGKIIGTIGNVSMTSLEPADLLNQEQEHELVSGPPGKKNPLVDDPVLSKALKQTLIMEHPAGRTESTERTFLEIPWVQHQDGWNDDFFHYEIENWKGFWEQVHSNGHFPAFDKFRKGNANFRIRGHELQHFFPDFWPKVSAHERLARWSHSSWTKPVVNPLMADIKHDMQLAVISLVGRRLVTTAEGHLGLAPEAVREGDIIAILGCPFPVVLRPGNQTYVYLGECYVHGVMNGEAMDGVSVDSLQIFNIS